VRSGAEFLATWMIFLVVGAGTVLAALILGRFLRPKHPTPQKIEPYECGEEPVGSSRIQYDVRIYVAALLFLIFEIEVALFFPPAVLFGKLIRWYKGMIPSTEEAAVHRFIEAWHDEPGGRFRLFPPKAFTQWATPAPEGLSPQPTGIPSKIEGKDPKPISAENRTPLYFWAWVIAAELMIFFGILLVGYAYLWACGDLEWSRPNQPGRL
jgi:NADH-quinone oxidoreductase subunit A